MSELPGKMRNILLPCAIAGLSCLMLAGCGSLTDSGGGLTDAGLAVLGNKQNQPPEKPTGPQTEYSCPSIDVSAGAAAHRIGKPGTSDVSYQASINDVVRECTVSGNRLILRVGIEGRMLLGSSGKPGTFSAPLFLTVKRGDKVVASRQGRVSATIPPGQGSVAFAHVEEGIALPLTSDPATDYEVFVGLSAQSGNAPEGKRRRR